MAEFQVATASLTESAATINSAKSDLANKITEMRSMSSRLLNMWEGEAKNAFVTSVNQNMNLLTNFANNLEKFRDALTQGASTYEQSEQRVTQIVSQKGQG